MDIKKYFHKKISKNKVIALYKWVLVNQKNHPYRLTILLASLTVSIATSCVNPLIFKIIFDSTLPSKNITLLFILLSIVFLLFFISFLGTLFQSHEAAKITSNIVNLTRLKLFRTIQNIKFDEITTSDKAKLISACTNDINFLEYSLAHTIWVVVQYVAIGVISACLLMYIDIYMTLLVIFLIPSMIIVSNKFLNSSNRYIKDKNIIENELFTMEDEGISMQDIVRYLQLKNYKRKLFKNVLKQYINTSYLYNVNLALASKTTLLGINLITLIVLGSGVYRVIIDSMTLGSLISFLVLLGNIGSSINLLSSHYPNIIQSSNCLYRINKLINIKFTTNLLVNKRKLHSIKQNIVFDTVTVKLDDSEIISKINLTIKPCQFVTIVGKSGSGKTTLLKLLFRETEITTGRILFDGIDIRNFSLNSLYAKIGVVHQKTKLFNISIKENIRLGKVNATDNEIFEAAKLAEVHNDILALPMGYDMIVTEKNLSGGQCKRIAIARTLISKPSIICLDEATANLDPITANAIEDTFARLAKKNTILSVTHRLRSHTKHDYIYVMQNGRLIQEGTHDSLIKTRGYYAKLWEKQQNIILSDNIMHTRISVQGLKNIPTFSAFDDATLMKLTNEFYVIEMDENQIVFDQGDYGDRFYLIVDGIVEVSVLNKDNNARVILARLYAGDFFGEVALIKNTLRNARITTKGMCVFLTLDNQQFQRLFSELPDTIRQRIINIAERRSNK